jgi:hypothetical protein
MTKMNFTFKNSAGLCNSRIPEIALDLCDWMERNSAILQPGSSGTEEGNYWMVDRGEATVLYRIGADVWGVMAVNTAAIPEFTKECREHVFTTIFNSQSREKIATC